MANDNGRSKGFGLVGFEKHEAQEAVDEMNSEEKFQRQVYGGHAQKKDARMTELQHRFEQMKWDDLPWHQRCIIHVKNLDDDIDDERLREEFSSFGTIISAKVTVKPIRCGVVCFSTPEEATKATMEMDGRIVGTKPLVIILIQSKDRPACLNPVTNPYPPYECFTAAAIQARHRAAYYPGGKLGQLRPSPRWVTPLFQKVPDGRCQTGPRPQTLSSTRPSSARVPHVMSTQRVANTATQTMGPRPDVCSFTQYKYPAGVRNPQQHLTAQPPVAMQQPECFMAAAIQARHRAAYYPGGKLERLRPSPRWVTPPFQNMPDGRCQTGPRPQTLSSTRPTSAWVPRVMSTQRVANTATQTMGPRPDVHSFTQYKYPAGVRNPQQHLTAQPPGAMQQPAVYLQGQEPLAAAPPQEQKQMLDEHLFPPDSEHAP